MDDHLKISGVRFIQKKESVPYHNRLTYKTTIILLILLKCCRGKGCSIIKLQLIINHLHSEESQERLLNYIENENNFVYLRYDSTVIRAVEYMNSDGLIELQSNGSFKITLKGKKIATSIWEDKEVFLFEKKFLQKIGSSLTENLVQKINNSVVNIGFGGLK